MKTIAAALILIILTNPLSAFAQKKILQTAKTKPGFVQLVFKNTFNGNPIVLNDSDYINVHGEHFSLSKLNYYVSNICVYTGNKKIILTKNSFLINQKVVSSMVVSFPLMQNTYDSIGFLLGVDSSKNVSGAQTGALDPLNDMFWTWNSGYVMQKIEGISSASNVINHKMEYHIGGFRGEQNTLQYKVLSFPKEEKLTIFATKNSCIFIEVAIDKLWKKNDSFTISNTPVCNSPGNLAKKIAGNFSTIFSVINIENGK